LDLVCGVLSHVHLGKGANFSSRAQNPTDGAYMRLYKVFLMSAFFVLAAAGPALADTVVLKFEGINAPGIQSTPIGNFYNGGGGPANNFGITFSSNALAVCLNTLGTTPCSNASRGGLGDPTSQTGGLFFLTGSQTFLDDAAGFTTGFSLFYSAVNGTGGSLGVYSGLDGTGTLLGTLALPVTTSSCSGYSAGFCPFFPVGVSFSGTAESISFAGVANEIVFDDVTFGSATPGQPSTVPEPASLMLVLTGAGAGVEGLRRRLLASRA
jgi:hypothetical protein